MKRKLWIGLVILFTLTLLGCEIAKTEQSGSCGENVNWIMTEMSGFVTLQIYGTGPMEDYGGGVSSPWFNSDVQIVEISEGVTHIGIYAFEWCTELKIVRIPASVTSIGFGAFQCCEGLTNIIIPDTILNIGECAFMGSSNLTSVTIQNPNTSIDGVFAFDDCSDSLVIHGWSGSTAETYATNAGIAFESLGDLSGKCGDNVLWTFDPLTNVLSISGNGSMTNYDTSLTEPPWYVYNDKIEEVQIAEGVSSIGSEAFYRCHYLNSVQLPNSMKEIGARAFNYCSGLKNIAIPYGLEVIGRWAFAYSGLEDITIPDSVTNIGIRAFLDTNLTSVEIPNSVTIIGESTFLSCTKLSSVTIPGSVTRIDDGAFCGCSNLTSVSVADGVESIGETAFYNCAFTSVTLPESLSAIDKKAFSTCSNLISVTISNPNAVIGDNNYDVFKDCSSNLTLLGYADSSAQTYANAAGISFVPINDPVFFLPASLTRIEEDAFNNIDAESVVIPKKVAAITGNPFSGSNITIIYGYPGVAETFANTYHYFFIQIDDVWMGNH